jgi:hypothetical protein
MSNGSPIQGYEVHLPVSVCASGQTQAIGTTDYISKRNIRFSLDQPFPAKQGTPVMLFVCLPAEITPGNRVLIRARGRIQRVERAPQAGTTRRTFTAKMDWYDFMGKSVKGNSRTD